jgi:hypothetical protein
MFMKRFFILLIVCATLSLSATAQKTRYVDATELGIHGYIKESKLSPYHRFDASSYEFPNIIVRYSKYPTGLYVTFKTNSTKVTATWENTPFRIGDNMTGILQLGLDLYMKQNGKWEMVGVGRVSTSPDRSKRTKVLVKGLPEGKKEFLLYLPGWCEIRSLQIGVNEDATIKGTPSPFKHKVVVHGSSITHGASASRPGMTYAARMSRNLGIDFVNFGFSGNCKMQPQFLEYLKDCKADAFVFDVCSNPTPREIESRLANFVKVLAEAHPKKPLIFINTPIPNRDDRRETAAVIMEKMTKRYNNVYFLYEQDVMTTSDTVDTIHPNDLGFDKFINTYQSQIAEILKKYGIKGK